MQPPTSSKTLWVRKIDSGCIRNFGTTDNYNTEMFEHFHIDYAKEAWRASNFCNELPQMTQWLSRQEKIVMFQSYISHYQSEEEREEEVKEAVDGRNQDVGVVTAKRPAAPSQTLSNIQTKHGCPSFSYHLRIFLNKFLTRGDSIPYTLGNDIDGQKGRGESSGRFDVVVVTHKDGAESTGLHVWPKHHFAYVEWLTVSRSPGTHHNMYSVTKPLPLDTTGHLPGDIVPLSTIRQSCQLIPHLGAGVGWPEDKYAYQILW
ncbi:uncharacterized protein EDB91DRAFT_1233081 [Suillus paluster]|uniref:uncharacterized protein n=1 Tax=Suillus paluster TaxID=48578 RepID=UPI001B86DBF9|nr:uncharacterized protein EDB91DRAFT_1233081 [Suillus paluster]KAG1756201.1 hypothetical protein EDB91DRAFT_1233081 [Suillus paluster]